jgi:GT2 family glycosyltransferase
MGKRVRRPGPPAHWILLLLFGLVLCAELGLTGYVTRAGAEGSEPSGNTGAAPGPTAAIRGGPVQRIAPDGTVSTRRMPARTIALTSNAIANAAGRRAQLRRPPYSSEPAAITDRDYSALRVASAAGYLIVLADRDTEDWKRPGSAAIAAHAEPPRGAGAVVMMHDAGGNRARAVPALDILIPRPQAQGYRFVTMSQALGLPAAPRATDHQRWRGAAFRTAQLTGARLGHALTLLVLAALVVAGLRLLTQICCAQIHRRRTRRAAGRRPAYLGPVSVVVPAYNQAATIAATVWSLARNDYPSLEIIVVDDGSTDGTADIVERLDLLTVTVLRQPNAGRPAALNTGIDYALADLLILVDGDTVFEPDTVGRLIQPLRDPAVGAVAGNTKVADRTGLLGRWQHLEYVMGVNLDRRLFDVARCMPTVPGAVGAFRRSALRAAGGRSDHTVAEDTDITMAVTAAGWRVIYEPAAVAWIETPATLRRLWRQRCRWCYGTMQAMGKHRHTLLRAGPAGRAGRRGLGYLLVFQVLLPLTAPMVDLYALYGLLFLPPAKVALTWAAFTAAQAATAAYALRLDREPLSPLWSLPLQQIVYRQLMYLVVIQCTVMALLGGRLRWHRIARTGAAGAHAGRPDQPPGPAAPWRADPFMPDVGGGPRWASPRRANPGRASTGRAPRQPR